MMKPATFPLPLGRLVLALLGLGVVTAGLPSRASRLGAEGVVALPYSSEPSDLVTSSGPSDLVTSSGELARVTRVVDGDTYDLLVGGQPLRLRLLGVDAPEHDQAFGHQATDSATALLLGRLVWLQRRGLDLYGRTLGAVRLPVSTVAVAGRAVPLDSLLVARGWAWAFDPSRAVAGRAREQAAAQRAGLGLWKCGLSEPVPPKLWRSFSAPIKRRYRGACAW